MRRFGLPVVALPALLALAGCGLLQQRDAGPPQFAELMPTTMLPPPAPMAPPPAASAQAMAPAAPMAATGPTYVGHLASYSKEADAIRGWDQIVRRQSSIGGLKRYLVPIDTARGPMVRLLAGDFPNMDEANRFCSWAKQQNLYCAVMQMDASRRMASPPAAPGRPAARPARQPAPAAAPMPAPQAPMPMAPAAPAPMAPMAPPGGGQG